ncbi:unnamed protein product [Ambrosiozyma monospora]|uniref:Unnamed protein product n=1 Tax=Ambrosiozyma monospora TaxID=43982 RepID=A0ACB5STI3_AMBMO|nr:unnamed protein product [Ambrosiozyma monospora]
MKKTQGTLEVSGSLLSCGCLWIQNATVRENITFGSVYNQQKYDTIVDSCCLRPDFNQLPGGDLTQVGERGITLSGGQKARINLARAVYSDKDIILMDDVLSAADAKVGKHIVNSCIMGCLVGKTRVLATHQLSLVGAADRVVFLGGDGTVDVGGVAELIGRNDGFARLMKIAKTGDGVSNADDQDKGIEGVEDDQLGRKQSVDVPEKQVIITEDEERAVNAIKFSVVWTYIKFASGIFKFIYLPLLITSVAFYAFFNIFSNTWLSFWISHKFPGKSTDWYLGLYICFSMLSVLMTVVTLLFIVHGTIMSSRKLNLLAVKRLMHAPLSYTDITPSGRILNRFTKDTDVLDNEITSQVQNLVSYLALIIASVILCIVYLPWFAIAVLPLLFLFVLLTEFYQSTSREVKRLEAIIRSSLFSQLSENLGGMDTIKAYKAESRFLKIIDGLIDNSNEAYFLTLAGQRYFAINMTILVAALALMISLLCCFRIFNIDAASTGLLLSYVLQTTQLLVEFFRSLALVENEMNSVERLKYYGFELPQEPPYRIPTTNPGPTWPDYGAINFNNVSLKYRQGLPYALKNLSIAIQPNEKVGICGRTGAGKSTLMACLYRLCEYEGETTIDGVDIGQLGLGDLRFRLSIIPQNPVLFSGDIRGNLDPFDDRSDDELWDSLRRAHLIEKSVLEKVKCQVIKDESMHKFHLSQTVEENGGNFSLGERQLLALARALVRKTKVLILDEATSSVDYETDSKIQKTIVEEFSNCTILCIAHRLNTIINYDRILVLEKGEIEEFDSPWKLFQSENGVFRSLCDQSGITANVFLKKN